MTQVRIFGAFHEMEYSETPTTGGTLMRGKVGRYFFEIKNVRGSFPTAYIHLPNRYPVSAIITDNDDSEWDYCLYNRSSRLMNLYDRIYLPVHEELTYDGSSKFKNYGLVLGWDYGHLGDYTPNYPGKKWTVLEILREVVAAARYLDSKWKKEATK